MAVRDEWQHGLCHPYAMAMMHLYPHLRFGEVEYPDESVHYFAHDDTHLYDSMGARSLASLKGHVDLDINPNFAGVLGTEQDIASAIQHIQQRGTNPRQANILDPIHDTLDARVWDYAGSPAPILKPAHKKWITKSVMDLAKQFHPQPEKWLRLVLTGSLTTYQYSDISDCDTSLFISPHFLPEWDRGKLIGLMVAHMDGTKLPGTPFEMQCFVVAKNISTADLYQPGLRSGYDIASDLWLVPPDRTRTHDVEREYNVDYVYALESADKMERLLRYDPDKAVQYWHQIHKRRMRDQKAGKGDFSQANIVYKMLANRGLFPSLSEASGEYIAKTAAKVLLNNFVPNVNHPKGQNGNELPFIYDPAEEIVHLGPANSFHWELIDRTPELKLQYNMKNKMQGAPFRFTDTHIHGRMEWPGKIVHYYGSPEPEVRQTINDALGAREAPQDSLNESQLWLD